MDYDLTAIDIAIVWSPNRAPILIAVCLADAIAPSATLNDAFAEVARLSSGHFDVISICLSCNVALIVRVGQPFPVLNKAMCVAGEQSYLIGHFII